MAPERRAARVAAALQTRPSADRRRVFAIESQEHTVTAATAEHQPAPRHAEAARRLRLIADLLREPADSPLRGAAELLGAGERPAGGTVAHWLPGDAATVLGLLVDVLVDPAAEPTYCARCAHRLAVDIPADTGRYCCDSCHRTFTIGGDL